MKQLRFQIQTKREEKELNLKFDVVDHVLATGEDFWKLKEIYKQLKNHGIDSVHFDWRWKQIQPNFEFNPRILGNYRKIAETIVSLGMEPPTIILSDPPVWARKLLQFSSKAFLRAYEDFLIEVKKELRKSGIVKINRIQVFNELNNPVWTPINQIDLPNIFAKTREVFSDYNPDLKIILSLLAGNLTELQGNLPDSLTDLPFLKNIPFQKSIWQYLDFFKNKKDLFDIISVCHYPGVWHLPIRQAFRQENHAISWSKTMFNHLEFLREIFEEVGKWGIDVEIGEIGFPTHFFWGDEQRQITAYKIFAKEIKNLLIELKSKGFKSESRITFYQAKDDSADTFLERFLSLTPYPEFNWGLMTKDGKPKKILENGSSPSELSNIIQNMKS